MSGSIFTGLFNVDYLMGQDVPNDKDVADVAKQVRDAAGPGN